MKYEGMFLDILEVFAEAHRCHHAWKGDGYFRQVEFSDGATMDVSISSFNISSQDTRAIERSNFVANRRIKSLAEYKRRLLAGERPDGRNIKAWQQAARSLGAEWLQENAASVGLGTKPKKSAPHKTPFRRAYLANLAAESAMNDIRRRLLSGERPKGWGKRWIKAAKMLGIEVPRRAA